MALFVCKNDPVTKTLRDLFPAHLLRIPEAFIQPMVVLIKDPESNRNRLRRVGPLTNVLTQPMGSPPDVQDSRMSDISGKRTQKVDLDLGLKLVQGFLNGFGVNMPSLGLAFESVQTVSFSFENVHRHFVDQGLLGSQLVGNAVNLNNPAVAVIQEGGRCLVVDSVIVSNNFTVKAEETSSSDFEFNLGDIQNLLGAEDQKVKVDKTSEKTLSFKGEDPLTFAFSCIELTLADDGRVKKFVGVKPGKKSIELGMAEASPEGMLDTETDEGIELIEFK